ncbi:MAG TPA: protein kinase [Terriglobales bacterium]|nr:protein kinase [Terriglobales bacterium]
MPINAGSRLGPYEIIAAAGAGGMGEVYRAKDTRLDRVVAIKVLPQHLTQDAHLRERFEREARAISSLSHPGICILHDIGSQDGVDFLVMEFLEGETLEQRIMKGPLSPPDVLRIGVEIADALEKAHRQGIVHRDLKPSNIMLTKSGTKLFDFGLAKRGDASTLASALTEMTASQKKLTSEGSIVGTFQYMAPEQLEGADADQRTDIFAFGEILYEMATGQPAFKGKTKASLIASILSSEPAPITTLQPLTPPGLDRIVRTCLAKDPDDRFQTVHDLKLQLQWVAEGGSLAGVPAPVAHRRKHRETVAWALAGALLAVTAASAWFVWRLTSEPKQVIRASILPPDKVRFELLAGGGPAQLSPDGHYVVYGGVSSGAARQLWLQALDASAPQPLPGTESATYPFWSPDSRSIGFFSGTKLKRIEVSGGPPQTLCDASEGRGGSWNAQGVIIFGTRQTGLYRVPASGGTATVLTELDRTKGAEGTHRWPWFLPDGNRYLFMAGPTGNDTGANQIYLGSLDSKERRLVIAASSNPVYASGYLLFRRESSLMAQPFDEKRGQTTGDAVPIAENLRFDAGITHAVFSASRTGLLLFQSGGVRAGSQLTWFDRTGKQTGQIGTPAMQYSIRISPDQKHVAAQIFDPAASNVDLWVFDVQRNVRTRLTFDPAAEMSPVWSPDSKRIYFASERDANRRQIFVKNADGSGGEERVLTSQDVDVPDDVSRDGRYLAFTRRSLTGSTGFDIWILPLAGEPKPFTFLQTQFLEGTPRFSPDGRWLAYTSDESGRPEVYVSPFPAGGTKWQISNTGGRLAVWDKNGSELIYLSPDNKLMAVDLRFSANSVQPGLPRELFQTRTPPTPLPYHVGTDGRILVITMEDYAEGTPLSLVTNWTNIVRK